MSSRPQELYQKYPPEVKLEIRAALNQLIVSAVKDLQMYKAQFWLAVADDIGEPFSTVMRGVG